MKTLEKLFFHTKMTWTRVLWAAVLCGVVVGALMIPPFLENTSLRQPGTTFEFWIRAALVIILNCEKPVEAGLKTFVFFLISQPIIYLVQVPFSWLHWGIFSYYPYWAKLTLLTLPGGMLAWYVRRGDILASLLLCAAEGLLCLVLPTYVRHVLRAFPEMLLAALFTAGEIVLLPTVLLRPKWLRLAVIVLAAGMAVLFALHDAGLLF